MSDLSHIPDEVWINVVAAVGWDESSELWPVLQKAVAAALPYLNTAKDSETAEPELVMGAKPDGSPWVVSAEFARSDVRVDGYGALRLYGKAVAPAAAHRIAKGLLAAIAWLENDGAAKAEVAASLRGEQGGE